MSAMTGRSVGRHHRQRCSTTHAIAVASMPNSTWAALPASSRPMPSRDTTAVRCGSSAGPDHRRILLGARAANFVLADIAANARRGKDAPPISPLALEAVKRIDALFDLERAINGQSQSSAWPRVRHSAPLVTELEAWMRTERARLSRHNPVAKAMDYMLKRWESFTVFLRDGRVCLTNNAAERALRGIALGRRAWLFAGSDQGGQRAQSCTALSPRPK